VNGVEVHIHEIPEIASRATEPAAYAELSGAQLAWVAATIPAVAAGWGTCDVPNPRLRFSTQLGRWVATYVDTGSEATGPDKDGTYRWKIECVSLQPTKVPGPGPKPIVKG
jgi:hypothetical protein